MAPVADPSGGARADGGAEKEPAIFRSRNYQLEMLEASMKENIIIAVGTPLSMSGREMTVLTVVDGYGEREDSRVRADPDIYQSIQPYLLYLVYETRFLIQQHLYSI